MIIPAAIAYVQDGTTTVRIAGRDWARAGQPSEVLVGGQLVRAWYRQTLPGGRVEVVLAAHLRGLSTELVVLTRVRADGAVPGRVRGVTGTTINVDARTCDYHDSPLSPGRSVLVQGGHLLRTRTILSHVSIHGAAAILTLPMREPAQLQGADVWIRVDEQPDSLAA